MTDLNEKALEAARKAHSDAMKRGVGFEYDDAALEDAIRAYLEAATPHDVADSEEEARIDNLRLRAFQTNAEQDRQAYFDAASKWFQDRHFRRMDAATALRLSAGGGWRSMDSAPQGPAILLDLGETIPDLVDARVGQYVTEVEAAKLGETLSASGGWIIWNSGDDWFVVPFDEAHGWQPLPASPTVEAGHVE